MQRPQHLRQRRRVAPKEHNGWHLYRADGAARGQGGDGESLGGWGAVFFGTSNRAAVPLEVAWGFLGPGITNNVAEYSGAESILRAASSLPPNAKLRIRGDSQLVIMQLTGRWATRAPHLHQKVAELTTLLASLQLQIVWEHIDRNDNWRADAIANLL